YGRAVIGDPICHAVTVSTHIATLRLVTEMLVQGRLPPKILRFHRKSRQVEGRENGGLRERNQ
ncbi:MAG TPA: hypothetical protein VFC02_20275, partial [Anaerolineales bacterium]|nr:hypothetical protein [Anaerolineales bacterium]